MDEGHGLEYSGGPFGRLIWCCGGQEMFLGFNGLRGIQVIVQSPRLPKWPFPFSFVCLSLERCVLQFYSCPVKCFTFAACVGVQGEVGQIVADRHLIAMEMDRVSMSLQLQLLSLTQHSIRFHLKFSPLSSLLTFPSTPISPPTHL